MRKVTNYRENSIVCCPGEDFRSSGAVAPRAFRGRGKATVINARCVRSVARQQNLQTSFQLHNVSLSGTVDVEMADTNTTLPPGPLLHTKKINLPRTDFRWKTAAHFGAGASVFANSTSNGVGVENGSQTFAHIPSQMLLDTPVFDVAQQLCPTPVFEKAAVPTENKECQASCVAEDWNIRSGMRESSLESLLGISVISQEQNFSLPALSKLCRVEDHLDLTSCLRSEKAVDDDSFL
ncbi:hypothetical protein Y032_0302g1854 [Ancylostoma ceylanicum]|uniref:Uncharacterized protein n=1 Tax=Ancylostoma ceylanicum TaxID=53326 RepID=A0A016S4R0_9BILA|nr:hypothetical protein Y032_0302g1854 [Ancylostoma ceylanicum]